MTTTDNRKSALDRLKSSKRPNQKSVWICMDPVFSEVVESLDQELKEAKFMEQTAIKPERPSVEVEALLITAKAQLKEHSEKFVFRGIGRKAYEKLVEAHAPSPEFLKKAAAKGINRDDIQWDADTFPLAAMEASLIYPHLEPGELTELLESDDWGDPEFTALFVACFAANNERADVGSLGNA